MNKLLKILPQLMMVLLISGCSFYVETAKVRGMYDDAQDDVSEKIGLLNPSIFMIPLGDKSNLSFINFSTLLASTLLFPYKSTKIDSGSEIPIA